MAKIFDKIFRRNKEVTVTKTRQKLMWYKGDLDRLDDEEKARKEKFVTRLQVKSNDKIKNAAFAACDKERYIDDINTAKLQKFDIKLYMSYRAVNHATYKRLFALKAGKAKEKFNSEELIWNAHFAALGEVKKKRADYVAKLDGEKKAFLEKFAALDKATADGEYEARKQAITAEYDAKLAEYDKKRADKRAKREQTLNAKIDKYSAKLDELLKEVSADRATLPADTVLSVSGLKMYFGGLKAVDDLTFDVKKGEIFGLIGPNGAGKTTVFNCITRFYNATGGDMLFCNKAGETVDLRRFKVHDVILQGISRTFQNVELVREISVIENLLVASTREIRSNLAVQALGLPVVKREEEILKARAMKILDFMGIATYANWLAMGLPYGILKKIEIARALMADATLVILDEPAAGLNDSETAELALLIKRIRDEFGVTILLVEHDMKLVMSICDRICAISFGRMLGIGTPAEIQANKSVQEAYLGVDEAGGAESEADEKTDGEEEEGEKK